MTAIAFVPAKYSLQKVNYNLMKIVDMNQSAPDSTAVKGFSQQALADATRAADSLRVAAGAKNSVALNHTAQVVRLDMIKPIQDGIAAFDARDDATAFSKFSDAKNAATHLLGVINDTQ